MPRCELIYFPHIHYLLNVAGNQNVGLGDKDTVYRQKSDLRGCSWTAEGGYTSQPSHLARWTGTVPLCTMKMAMASGNPQLFGHQPFFKPRTLYSMEILKYISLYSARLLLSCCIVVFTDSYLSKQTQLIRILKLQDLHVLLRPFFFSFLVFRVQLDGQKQQLSRLIAGQGGGLRRG